jgi:outer membrane protein assembly factor BamB
MLQRHQQIQPKIAWEAHIGSIQSRNNIISQGAFIYIGTCGEKWNQADRGDGVYCLRAATGEIVWFSPTYSDVNEITLARTDLIVPTDSGEIFILEKKSGAIKNVLRLDGPIFSKPLVRISERTWSAIIVSAHGKIYELDAGQNVAISLGDLGYPVRANLTYLDVAPFPILLVLTETGYLMKCTLFNGKIKAETVRQIKYIGFNSRTRNLNIEDTDAYLHAVPARENNLIFGGYARDTYYDDAPLYCINVETGEELWRAHHLAGINFGNCRTTPLIVGGELVVSLSYADSVYFLNKYNGRVSGEILLGQTVFQQWSSPVAIGKSHAVVSRIDGVVSVIDIRHRKLVASVSLAAAEIERLKSTEPIGAFPLGPWEPPIGGICGTPLVKGNRIFVGATSGRLVAIDVFARQST